MHKYDVELDYDPENAFQETEVKEKKYKSFFGTLKAMIRDKKVSDPQKIDQTDLEFDKFLEEIKTKVHESFCNNFHTPGVIKTLDDGIKRSNIYMSGENPKAPLLIKAFKTLNKPFESMGLFYTHEDE
jgi:cysteinyl-tRNA synthetase